MMWLAGLDKTLATYAAMPDRAPACFGHCYRYRAYLFLERSAAMNKPRHTPVLKRILKQAAFLGIAILALVFYTGMDGPRQSMPSVEAAMNQQSAQETPEPVSASGHARSSPNPEPSKPSATLRIASASTQRPFHTFILQASETYQVDPALIKAIIMAESNYDPQAISHRGAQGLMQLMPMTAKWLGVTDAFDPALNIDAGVRYFRYLLDRFKGDVELALAAYNAGIAHVQKHGGIPPFRATQAYVKKVLEYHQHYQQELAINGLDSSSA
jgi:soluble lytic murein transglycosylase-like protein